VTATGLPSSWTERLGPSFDLLAAFGMPGVVVERRGLGVAGAGRALVLGCDPSSRASIAAVVEALRTIAGGRIPSPAAVGGLPFAGTGPWELTVPEAAVRRHDADVTWRVDVDHGPGERDAPMAFTRGVGWPPHEAFADPLPRPTAAGYAEAVRKALRRIDAGELRKVVLARTIEVQADRELDPRRLAHRLRAVDPDAYTFAVPTDAGLLVGASPELLIAKRGREIRSNPLAGSAPRAGDPEEDRALAAHLEASAKDREEHAIVVDSVAETLRPFCEELRWDPEPVLLETANVWHLSTRFHGVLREPAPSVLELVAALHPTPAVGGMPREAALRTIAELEPFDRGRYAGPVGWVDADGDGEWAIALRCAELRADRATLYAGAGIVAGSDPSAEVDETERKFRAFLDALRWG
jgi:isochorismate synthase